MTDPLFADEHARLAQDDLRHQTSSRVLDALEALTSDSVEVFPYSGSETLDPAYCRRIGEVLARLLGVAIRDGRVDPRGGLVADLHRIALERGVPVDRLFTFAYLIERTTLDELALDEAIGATAEPWPLVAQLVRRASFDLLAAYTERTQLEPSDAAVIDRLTTLYTRPMFDAVLPKEIERAARFGHQISLILFDVDRLSRINNEHGYGVGDRILERLGILIRNYFRQHDWVARQSEDAIAVLLTRTEADDAAGLAERVRHTVEERLEFHDHRNDRRVRVTLSAAVVNAQVVAGDVLDAERLMAEAEAAVERAKHNGRNRVERVDYASAAEGMPRLPGLEPQP